ncbi:MAG: hypothetical protein LBP27_03090 [Treponema sp.]|nr:hypothetical protein [Treponema sp.]
MIQYRNPDYSPLVKVNRIKNAFIITGSALVLSGIVVQTLGVYRVNNMDDRTADILQYCRYAPLGLGMLFLGAAVLINPEIPIINAGSDAAK